MASQEWARGRGKESGRFEILVSLLDRERTIAVQTHDYPDLDAMASAWALSSLLTQLGFDARPCYRGSIHSRSLMKMIGELHIELDEAWPRTAHSQVIVVDGSPFNGNVSLVDGQLLAIIDHHESEGEQSAPFIDIQPNLASCSTLIADYWNDARLAPPRDIATALLAGIQSDTDFLARSASASDFASYLALFDIGDFSAASRIVRTVLDLRELDLVTKALLGAEIRGGIFFAWLPGPCGQEVLAVLAEFILRTEELRVAIVAECGHEGRGPDDVHLSLRSKDLDLSAFMIIKKALAGIGSGGGHAHAAGGRIPLSNFPGKEALKERFFECANSLMKE